MKTVCYIDIPDKDNGHGVSVRKLLVGDEVQVIHLKLKPGEVISSHTTPVNVFFYILEGSCTIEIGNERKEVSRDVLVESPADIPHAIYNESPRLVRLLCVKLMKRESS